MALDNIETRSFVKRLCMTLDIPVLDAGIIFIYEKIIFIKLAFPKIYNKGTTGYLG